MSFVLNCVLGSLAAITGTCYMVKMYEAILIGLMSGLITFLTLITMERLSIDDPCGSFAVHGMNGAWGLLAMGLFAKKKVDDMEYDGLLYGGGLYLLGVQALTSVVIGLWSLVTTFLFLWSINKLVPLRSSLIQELLGADYSEHNILHGSIGIEKAVEVLQNFHDNIPKGLDPTGNNLGHMMYLEDNFAEGFENRPDNNATENHLSNVTDMLNLILGSDAETSVTNEQVEEFVQQMPSNGDRVRRATSGGAFGRQRPI